MGRGREGRNGKGEEWERGGRGEYDPNPSECGTCLLTTGASTGALFVPVCGPDRTQFHLHSGSGNWGAGKVTQWSDAGLKGAYGMRKDVVGEKPFQGCGHSPVTQAHHQSDQELRERQGIQSSTVTAD